MGASLLAMAKSIYSNWLGGFLVVVTNYFQPLIGKRKGFKVN